jgi:serine/threonine protein kinase
LELAWGGDLYDFVKTGRLEPDVVCFFFKKMVAGLEYMHGNGVYHRDIKPENILLNSNLELKIADFGFSKNHFEMGGSKTTKTVLGTRPYMAPEILAGRPYDPAKCDIFAVGHILFILYSGYFAFQEATLKNPLYNFLLQDKPDVFWRYHDKQMSQIPGFFTPAFKKLVLKMIHPDPSKRATL